MPKLNQIIAAAVKYSGAIPAAQKNAMLERVRLLQDAVKSAREEAKGKEVETKKVGEAVLDSSWTRNISGKSLS